MFKQECHVSDQDQVLALNLDHNRVINLNVRKFELR